MMLLQYFTRGAWFVTLGTYLGKSMEQPGTFIGFSYSLFGIGAIISPFFVGIVADRFFPTQRVLGVLNIAAGVIMLILSQITDPTTFLWALFIYCIIYTPTEALSNSIVFHHMPRRYFAYIRLFGTIGWVFAGLAVNMLLGKFIPNVEATAVPLIMSAVASAILGIYNFTLPPTPVKNKGEKIGIKEVFGFEALSLLKQRNFSIFLGASLLIGIPIQMYFAFFNMFLNDIGVSNVASKMSLGQVSEAAFMVFIPWMIGRVGLKWMMSLGLAFWSIRYFLFAGISVNAEYLIIFSILIHGACYDFFNVTGSIYVDLKAGERYRSAAQGLFMLVFLGLGKFFGSNLAGFISTKNPSTVEGFLYDWSGIFNTTGIITAAITVLFIFSFHDKQKYDLNKDN
jgi:nucleoside transporter|tara:strand:+ start:212 stop:1402 length:1191 start_codon:yes stop_codon:yes gene_type:complete